MEYTDQKLSWGWGMETVEVGDLLLFKNQPNSWEPKKKKFFPVEFASGYDKEMSIGKVLTKPEYSMGSWSFETDLQAEKIYHRRDLLIIKVIL